MTQPKGAGRVEFTGHGDLQNQQEIISVKRRN
jgi:hypothetical protein